MKPKAVVFLYKPGPLYRQNLKQMTTVAQRQGYKTIVVTPHTEPLLGRSIADQQVFCKTPSDVKSIVNSIDMAGLQFDVERIFPLHEQFVEAAATLRRRNLFNCQGLSVRQARLFRDKDAMHRRADEIGIPTPRSCRPTSLHNVATFAKQLGYPIILKPRRGSGCADVQKIKTLQKLQHAMKAIDKRRQEYRVEEFIAGTQYHVETLVHQGRIVFSALFQYTYNVLDYGTTPGGTISRRSLLTGVEQNILHLNSNLLLDFFADKSGIAHAEFFARPTRDGLEVVLGEVGARPGGGPIVPLVEAAHGINLAKEWAKMTLDPNYQFRAPDAPHPGLEVGTELFMNGQQGTIVSIASPEQLRRIDPWAVLRTDVWKSPNDELEPPKKSTTGMLGFQIVAGRDKARIKQTFAKVRQEFDNRLVVDSTDGRRDVFEKVAI